MIYDLPMPACAALIVAAGRGLRVGGDVPKQYLPLAGEPVLRRTIRRLADSPFGPRCQVVIASADRALYDAATAGLDLPPPAIGGASRQASVLAGLEALAADPPDLVAIHDAARPLVETTSLSAAFAALEATEVDGALVAVPIADTVKRVEAGRIASTLPRDGLWRAQTPQVFRYPAILAAHRAAAPLGASESTALTDDCAVAERAGLLIVVVPGTESNFKITAADDLVRAERLLGAMDRAFEYRTGTGFDVHAFGPGDTVHLCGVAVPHGAALVGHSDADVALHALTDAVLGAIGAGDIGRHFPPSDPQWRGASSDRFLRHASGLVEAAGGRIVHLDVTIVCEAPKIGPHRAAMVEAVARIAGIAPDRVSVKATTTERLGFTGRREGIAAQAAATVELPRRS